MSAKKLRLAELQTVEKPLINLMEFKVVNLRDIIYDVLVFVHAQVNVSLNALSFATQFI